MGTHGGDSGNPPPDGDHPPDEPVELPELPPEWGDLKIPDDASELAAEAEQVRRELAERRAAEHPPFSLFRCRPRSDKTGDRGPSVGGPLLVMSMAVLITMISLFAMAWSGTRPPAGADPQADPVETLPQVTLTDASGVPVPLGTRAPLAILLIEECDDCAGLVAATAAAAPEGVTVAAVGHSAPAPPPALEPGVPEPLLLSDPYQLVRASLALDAPTNAATVVLVNADQRVTHTFPAVTAIGQYRAELVDLAP